jgi:hypothetical protein
MITNVVMYITKKLRENKTKPRGVVITIASFEMEMEFSEWNEHIAAEVREWNKQSAIATHALTINSSPERAARIIHYRPFCQSCLKPLFM